MRSDTHTQTTLWLAWSKHWDSSFFFSFATLALRFLFSLLSWICFLIAAPSLGMLADPPLVSLLVLKFVGWGGLNEKVKEDSGTSVLLKEDSEEVEEVILNGWCCWGQKSEYREASPSLTFSPFTTSILSGWHSASINWLPFSNLLNFQIARRSPFRRGAHF